MPSIFELYEKFKDRLSDPVVIRLHGMDREGIEERTNNKWDTIVDPRDDEVLRLRNVVSDLRERRHHLFINVNNHYEGSAPRTIEKIKGILRNDGSA